MFLPSRLICVLSLILLLERAVPVFGQSDPIPVTAPAYTRYGSKLYISGGGFTRNLALQDTYAQFLSIDLSVAWDAANPVWNRLASGPKQYNFPAAMSSDGRTMAAFRTGDTAFTWLYNVAGDLWTQSKVTVPNPGLEGIFAVTDPISNIVYLAGGYKNDTVLTDMLVYHFDTDTITQSTMPANGLLNRRYYKGVWWAQKQSIIYFGGYHYGTGDPLPNSLLQFTPSTNTWTTLATNSIGPSGRADFCMEIADDGSKLVVFGGRVQSGSNLVLTNDLFILDLSTLTWTRGQNYTSSRTYPACTIVNSTFISWGGQDDVATVSKSAVLYNLNTNQYITRFIPPESPPSNPTEPSNSSSNTGAIVGGVVGSLAVIVLAGMIFFMKRQKNRKQNAMSGDHPLVPYNRSEMKTERRSEDRDSAAPVPSSGGTIPTAYEEAKRASAGPQQYGYRTVQTHNALRDYQNGEQDSGNYRAPQYVPDSYVVGSHGDRKRAP
ncbi:hypothetical protein BGX28_009284 [Mortierella sp. GBA30]|nr:hypothetical protein BGX28_009284 [Mortierella sp. GBA30]